MIVNTYFHTLIPSLTDYTLGCRPISTFIWCFDAIVGWYITSRSRVERQGKFKNKLSVLPNHLTHSLSRLVTVPHAMGACGRSHLYCKWPKTICWIVDLVGGTSERYLINYLFYFRLRTTSLISLSPRIWSLFLSVVVQLDLPYDCCRQQQM